MGQISIPAINKTGYSMYWSSMWDDKNNYARHLKEDIYIRKFIPVLLEDNISFNIKSSFYNPKKDNFDYINNKYNLQLSQDFNKNNLIKYIKSLSKVPFYFSKIWIFRYQSWVLIFFYMYSPVFNSFFKKENPEIEEFDNSLGFNILYNYYVSVLKLSYKYEFFKKSINKDLF